MREELPSRYMKDLDLFIFIDMHCKYYSEEWCWIRPLSNQIYLSSFDTLLEIIYE